MEALSSQLEPLDYSAPPLIRPHLRLVLDARKIEDGGIGTYIQNLICGLVQRPEIELSLIVRSAGAVSRFNLAPAVRLIEHAAASYSLEEMFLMARGVNWADYDLYHSPHYTLPYGIKIPTVVTIHDLIHLQYPEKNYHRLIAKPLILSALKRGDRILTVSAATYRDLCALLGPASKLCRKIQVVPNAVDPFFTENPIERELSIQHVAYRFGLRGQFLLGVLSNAKPHKGITDLLQAFARLREYTRQIPSLKSSRELKLVLVGQGSEGLVFRDNLLEEAGAVPGVHLLGQVSRDDLLHLYSAARALVVPSLAEGFCLPVIEAQALGTPVIARPVPAVLELLSANDLACRDLSLRALESALIDFVKRPIELRFEPKDLQMQQHLRRFLLKDMTRSVLDVYKQALKTSQVRP